MISANSHNAALHAYTPNDSEMDEFDRLIAFIFDMEARIERLKVIILYAIALLHFIYITFFLYYLLSVTLKNVAKR